MWVVLVMVNFTDLPGGCVLLEGSFQSVQDALGRFAVVGRLVRVCVPVHPVGDAYVAVVELAPESGPERVSAVVASPSARLVS